LGESKSAEENERAAESPEQTNQASSGIEQKARKAEYPARPAPLANLTRPRALV
jgi:hypothetical protein